MRISSLSQQCKYAFYWEADTLVRMSSLSQLSSVDSVFFWYFLFIFLDYCVISRTKKCSDQKGDLITFANILIFPKYFANITKKYYHLIWSKKQIKMSWSFMSPDQPDLSPDQPRFSTEQILIRNCSEQLLIWTIFLFWSCFVSRSD